MNFKILYIIFFIFFKCNTFQAQESTFGFTAGLSFSFGNKVNRIGLRTSAFYGYQFVQINAQVNFLYNFQTLALNNKTPEIQVGVGTQLGWSKSDTITNRFMGLIDKNIAYILENDVYQRLTITQIYDSFWKNKKITQI